MNLHSINFLPIGDSVGVAVHIKPDENGTLKETILVNRGQFTGISVDDEFEKFLETMGGKDIMNTYAEVNMKDYLTMLKNFDAKKFEALESDIIRIFVPVTLDALISQKFLRWYTRSSANHSLWKRCHFQQPEVVFFKFCL